MSIHITLPRWPWEPIRAVADRRGVAIWPVGGVVRDMLLGRSLHDWDFAVERDAMGMARAVADALGGAYFPLDEGRDTARVVVRDRRGRRIELDFAGLRGETLLADLRGRDFTINAMAIEPSGALIDPLGGLADLQARLVRAIGPHAFDADPLRMLRAVRLTAELEMRLEAKTAAWIIQRAESLTQASPERIRDEFARILATPSPAEHVHMLDELRLLAQVIPEVPPLKEQPQSPPHRFDVWWHTLLVIDAVAGVLDLVYGRPPLPRLYADAPESAWDDVKTLLGPFVSPLRRHLSVRLRGGRKRPTLLVLAALCHDLGKPVTCTEDDQGHLHFYGHEREGARIAARRLRRLRFSQPEVKRVATVVRAHLRPGHLARVRGPVTRRAIYRFFRATGSAGVEVNLLSLADHLATWGPNLEPDRWTRRLEVVQLLLSHYFERHEETVAPKPLVGGRELIESLGIEEGPLVGRLLEAIREAQASGEVHTREEALALARRLKGKNHNGAEDAGELLKD
ncbi:MAG TPA: CCA tRNA nucleotidyltransferase [Anaerolineae bacterium]|nr:CCA tRNA nucleotidyltransferase [Anaerolineae bacterium]